MYNVIAFGFSSELGKNIIEEIEKNFNLEISFDDFKKEKSIPLMNFILNIENFNYDSDENYDFEYSSFFRENFDKYHILSLTRGLKFKEFFETQNEFFIYFNFFVKQIIKKKIDLIIFSNIPHQGPDYILYKLAQKFEIKTIILYQSIFFNKYFQFTNMDDFGKFQKIPNNINYRNNYELKEYYTDLYEKMLSRHFKKNKRKLSLRDKIRKLLTYLNIISREDQNKTYIKKISEISIDLNEINKIEKENNILFITLHEQPELTTTMLGKEFLNQLDALEKLSVLLKKKIYQKKEWKIIVKDHYRQTSYMRGKLFFKRLEKLENVFVAKTDIQSEKIIELSKLIATVSGTIVWESLKKQKKSCYFGQPWYSFFKNSMNIDRQTTYQKISEFLEQNFDLKQNELDFDYLKKKLSIGDVNEFYINTKDYDYKKNAENIVKNLKNLLQSKYVEW